MTTQPDPITPPDTKRLLALLESLSQDELSKLVADTISECNADGVKRRSHRAMQLSDGVWWYR